MHRGPTDELNTLLTGTTIERVEEAEGAYEGGQFTLVVAQTKPDGKKGKSLHIRVCGTDMGWWFETREGNKGKWKRC